MGRFTRERKRQGRSHSSHFHTGGDEHHQQESTGGLLGVCWKLRQSRNLQTPPRGPSLLLRVLTFRCALASPLTGQTKSRAALPRVLRATPATVASLQENLCRFLLAVAWLLDSSSTVKRHAPTRRAEFVTKGWNQRHFHRGKTSPNIAKSKCLGGHEGRSKKCGFDPRI